MIINPKQVKSITIICLKLGGRGTKKNKEQHEALDSTTKILDKSETNAAFFLTQKVPASRHEHFESEATILFFEVEIAPIWHRFNCFLIFLKQRK